MEVTSEVLAASPETIGREVGDYLATRAARAVSPCTWLIDRLQVELKFTSNASGQTLAEAFIRPADEGSWESQVDAQLAAEVAQKTQEAKAANRSYNWQGLSAGCSGGVMALIIALVVGYYNGWGWGIATWIGATLLTTLAALPAYNKAAASERELEALKREAPSRRAQALEAMKASNAALATTLAREIANIFKRLKFAAG